jgi:hypothetical protein
VVEVVPEEDMEIGDMEIGDMEIGDTETEDMEIGDLSLLDLHRDGATSGQPHLGRLRELDMEDKIKKQNSLLYLKPRIINPNHFCHRHLQAVDVTVITGSTLDGKSNFFLYIYR